MSISDTIRRQAADSGLSRHELARRIGCHVGRISRFLKGENLSSDNLDRLAEVLGLAVVSTHNAKD